MAGRVEEAGAVSEWEPGPGMSQCEVWGCRLLAVERLEHFNPLCGGTGHLDVCPLHFIDWVWEHFLI